MAIEIDPTRKLDGEPHAVYVRLPEQFDDSVRESGPVSFSVDLRVYAGRGKDGTPWSHVYFMKGGKTYGDAFPLNPRSTQPIYAHLAKFLENIARLLFKKLEEER